MSQWYSGQSRDNTCTLPFQVKAAVRLCFRMTPGCQPLLSTLQPSATTVTDPPTAGPLNPRVSFSILPKTILILTIRSFFLAVFLQVLTVGILQHW